MILALCLALAALVFILWLLFTCATYALPMVVGVLGALVAYRTGAGWLGAPVVGVITAIGTLAAGRLLLQARSPALRTATVALFSAPAGVAGYHAMLGITALGAISGGWRTAFASVAAILIACAAARQLAAPALARSEPG